MKDGMGCGLDGYAALALLLCLGILQKSNGVV